MSFKEELGQWQSSFRDSLSVPLHMNVLTHVCGMRDV